MIMRVALRVTLTITISSLACQLFQPFPPVTSTETIEFRDPIKIEITDVTMIYYEITGSTANELREEMNKLGPLDLTDGLCYDARTDWYVSWTWPGYGKSECDLSKTNVNYDIKVTVPVWKPKSDIDPALVDRWNHYMNSLALHEQGHVDIIVDHYLKVKDAIQAATCDTAEQAAQEVSEELRSLNEVYDRETQHGNLQGAVFP